MRKYILIVLVFCTQLLQAQLTENYNTEQEGKGGYYYKTGFGFGFGTKDTLPFWLLSNKFGLVPSENYALWDIELKKEFKATKRFDWAFGVVAAASVADEVEVQFRDYYIGARYRKLRLYVGAKAVPVIYDGLSSTNGNFICSSNARPYPKILLEIPYVDVPFTRGWVQFKGAISEGIMYDNRYVDKPHVHNKNLYFKVGKERWAFEVGLEHYVQWSGTSPKRGKLPTGLDVYKDLFFAKDNSKYDQLGSDIDYNRVGNHLGMYDVRFHYAMEQLTASLYRQVIFEDSSGRNFMNRDALMGIFVKRNKENAWAQSFLLEYYYTKKQSGNKVGAKPDGGIYTGRDNYFNQSVYRSGWTSYGHTIGTPFFTPLPAKGYVLGVANNRIEALHGGVFGYVASRFPYRLMLSYSNNTGTYSVPFNKNQISGYFEMTVPFKIHSFPINATFGFAADKGEYLNDNFGVFAKISTNGWWKK